MDAGHGLAGDIRQAVASEQFDLGGFTEARTRDLVVAAFGTPLTAPTEMIRFTFVVGGGKLVRARYSEQLPKWMTAALREVGFVEDRSSACTLDSQGTYKQQKDTGANLLTIQVFPRLALAPSSTYDCELEDKQAAVDVDSPEYLCISSDLETFQRMIVPAKARSWVQKKRLLKALQASMQAFQHLEEKLVRGENLLPVEQLMYDGNIGLEVNTEKCTWLQGEIKRMVDEGHLTKAEKEDVLATLQQNLEHVAAEIDAASGKKKDKLLEKQSSIQARLALVEGHNANVVYRLRKSADIVKLRVELLAVLALQEKERSLSLTSEDMRRLEGRHALESTIADLEEQSREWFDEDFDSKCVLDEKEAEAQYKKKKATKPSGAKGGGSAASSSSWATIGKKKPVAKAAKPSGVGVLPLTCYLNATISMLDMMPRRRMVTSPAHTVLAAIMMWWHSLSLASLIASRDIVVAIGGEGYVVVPSQRNQNFACCGGCSSGVRADASLLPRGARIVLWDATVKVAPSDQCRVTFPFEPSNGELPGSRRVRSGKLVGSSFPIDHDADALCCQNGGQCSLSEEDATGRCDCVVQYGYAGASCELSVYDIAASNNSRLSPSTFVPKQFAIQLPDLRHALESFPVTEPLLQALLSSASSNGSDAMDPSLLLYRKRVFPPAALGVAASMGLASIFILLSLVKCCIKPRIYSIFEKMVTMLLMLGLAFVAATCLTWAGEQWLNLHQQSTNLTALLNVSLPSNVGYFFATMLTPLAATMQGQNFTSIPAFQKQTAAQMELYAELNQTDLQGLFQQALEPVKAVAKQFPTATRCENVVIVRSSFSVMSVGAATGCFQCPKCAAITANIQQVELDWFRGVQAIHFILFQSHVNLIEFSTLALEPQLDAFQKSLHYTKEAVEVHTQRLSVMLASLTHSFALLLDYGLYTWWACSFVTSVTCVAAAIVGIKYKSGVVAKGASFLAQVSTLLGFGLTGVAWSLAFCARDGIELLQSFDQNATVLFPDATVSIGVSNLLHDQSLVANHSLTQIL
ncbi:hypothetical protein, variant [Aphanomyces invadans]|uniref:EGF-like domain-containing protein n=1 Tax=Aphanomyces invadans TaxID=157072 RepID=A0A024TC22_9STRA|nr:hypothetical protein, variant [Aphanomyces invadans]ETV90872.1 hypothetical protein, variant [Aphanomyces invadans]|eukprot:XP_008880508.1 hypothetical protein, variant [Aphanomyces invadans]